MPKCIVFLPICLLLILTGSAVDGASSDRVQAGPRTALDRYVNAMDTNYSFRLAKTIPGEGYTTYQVEMFSQVWLTTNEVNRPLWQHWLTIVKPNRVSSSTALLFIGGGGNSTNPPGQSDKNLLLVATNTQTVVAELKNVPNQPLIFTGGTTGRSED